MRLLANKKTNITKLLSYDASCFDGTDTLLIGVDEVGRGCIAGPVATAAFAYDINSLEKLAGHQGLQALNDSKKLSARQREEIVAALAEISSLSYEVNFHTAQDIDSYGIVHCIWQSMLANIEAILSKANNYNKVIILVDGPRKIKGFERLTRLVEQRTIVRGDGISAAIAAASNIAKVARDKYMQELAASHPNYAWHTNVGYATERHRQALHEHGLTEYHRRSFVQGLLAREQSLVLN